MRFNLSSKPTLGVLAALAFGSLASAQTCPGADTYEPNDDCAGAVPAAVGATLGLSRMGVASTTGENPDYYTITVPAFTNIQIDLTFVDATGDIDLYLWDSGSCNLPMDQAGFLVRGYTGSDNESVTFDNGSGSAADYVIGVDAFGSTFDCNDYDMNIVLTSLLICPGADAFEPNDDCATTSVLASGATGDLSLMGQANTGGVNEDNWSFTLQDGEIATIDASFVHANGDIDLFVYDDAGTCLNEITSSETVGDVETVIVDNQSGAAVDYVLNVFPYGTSFDCNDYSLNMDVVLGTAVCPAADAFEPNDDCLTPSTMVTGLTQSLSAWGPGHATPNDDFWTYTMVNNEILTIDVLFIDANGDIDVYLYDDAACSNQVDYGGSTTDNEELSYTNVSGGPVTLTMKTRYWGSFVCNDYELELTSVVDPCLSIAEDSYAPNHDCASAVAITDGVYPGLAVFLNPETDDFFTVDVVDGATVFIDVLHIANDGDIDCYLYDSSTLGTDCGTNTNYLVRGYTGSDNENIQWTNTSGGTVTYYLQVELWDSASNGECNNYDLVIDVALPTMGLTMCAGDGSLIACPCGNESADPESGCLNSTGLGAKIFATGSNSAAADDAVFHIEQATAGQTAVLVQGTTTVAVPFKDGILCMGTWTRRVEFVNLDAAGEGSTATSIVTGGNVVPGETKYYQWWYRDTAGTVCGSGSNLSDGLQISWI